MPDARVRAYAYTYMYDCLVTQPLGASPYVPSGHPDVSPWPSAAQRPYVYLMKTYVLMFSLKKKLGIAKVICKPSVLVPKTAQESSLSKLGEMAHV